MAITQEQIDLIVAQLATLAGSGVKSAQHGDRRVEHFKLSEVMDVLERAEAKMESDQNGPFITLEFTNPV